jgi:NADPH-dependent 2,4-dienoyl-CoA reductase/sulfur reductase-like enzyme
MKLVEWCRHPDILEPLFPGRISALEYAGGKCGSFIDFETKVMPGVEPPWPMPMDMAQLLGEMTGSLPIEYKNSEKRQENAPV